MTNLKTIKVNESTIKGLNLIKYTHNIKSLDSVIEKLIEHYKHTQLADDFFKKL